MVPCCIRERSCVRCVTRGENKGTQNSDQPFSFCAGHPHGPRRLAGHGHRSGAGHHARTAGCCRRHRHLALSGPRTAIRRAHQGRWLRCQVHQVGFQPGTASHAVLLLLLHPTCSAFFVCVESAVVALHWMCWACAKQLR